MALYRLSKSLICFSYIYTVYYWLPVDDNVFQGDYITDSSMRRILGQNLIKAKWCKSVTDVFRLLGQEVMRSKLFKYRGIS